MGSVRGQAKSVAFRRAVLLVLLAAGSTAQAAGRVAVKAEIGGDGEHTRYVAFLSKATDYRIFSISDPYRIVVDLPEADIQVPAAARGLVLSSRSGRLAAGKSRIVIDLAGPAVVEKSGMLPPENGLPARLVIELVKSAHKDFIAQCKAPPPLEAGKPVQNAALEELGRQKAAHRHRSGPWRGRQRRARPLVQHPREGCRARLQPGAGGEA